jgi:uncharacterized membrane protein YgdD (TMEM256/DUF423 family)
LTHALALFLVALLTQWLSHTGNRRAAVRTVLAGWLFTAGILVFSGSLYALSLSGIRVLGAITPIGGVCFLSGWVVLLFAPVTQEAQ